jgi:cytidylate kinase
MYRAITVAREFGSGGAIVAGIVAERLKWKLLDRALLEAIAGSARVAPDLAARFDECVDPWLHRLGKQSLWRGVIEGVSAVPEDACFDSEAMARFATRIVRDAAEVGQCVIVGRGAQCILAGRPDVFHVFVYGAESDKIGRVRERFPGAPDPAALMRERDRQRAAYIRSYFQREWRDPELYDLMVNSRCGEQAAAEGVLCAARLAG